MGEPELHAVILCGGRGSRLGGADKAALRPEGAGSSPLLDRVLAAVDSARSTAARSGRTVLVGPEHCRRSGTVLVRESPPGAGPLAGIAAGVRALSGDEAADATVVVLACDLPHLDPDDLVRLVDATGSADESSPMPAVALAVDPDGCDQVLLAAWRLRALMERLRSLDSTTDRAVRALLDGTVVRRVRLPGRSTGDVDTWSDLAALGPIGVDALPGVIGESLRPLDPHPLHPRTADWDVDHGVLAAGLVAASPQPRHRVSAMDGFAVAGPPPWRLLDPLRAAGVAAPLHLSGGKAVRIATGALAPDGCERVIRHERVEVRGGNAASGAGTGSAHPLDGAEDTDDLRPVGEDWQAGDELAPAGTGVDAALLSTAVTAGVAELSVRGPVRARIVTTGDEIVATDHPDPLPAGTVRDTVGPALPAVLTAAGLTCDGAVTHCSDDPAELAALLAGPGGATRCDPDVLVLVGATGRGPADHLRGALAEVGARVVLDGVRMRPGGSQLVALLPGGAVLLAVPGNPLAAVCASAVTGRAVVDALTGRRRDREFAQVTSAAPSPWRARVVPVRPAADGNWVAEDHPRTSHLADLAGRPALAVLPESAVAPGLAELLRLR